uniref:hypothetical protein n=1 Tax=Thiolapillus sp. TaxID=2017437 RepID=UPI003AF8E1B6
QSTNMKLVPIRSISKRNKQTMTRMSWTEDLGKTAKRTRVLLVTWNFESTTKDYIRAKNKLQSVF